MTDSAPASDRASVPGPLLMLRGLALDVGLPVVTYYVLHLLGASDWAALLAASAVAALRIVWTAVRDRQLNAFATVMLLVYGLGFLLSLMTGDPRTVLLRNSFVTGAVGIAFLISAIHGKRPLTLAAQQSFSPAEAEQAQRDYDTMPEVRRGHRLSSTVWGCGLLADAVLRIPIVLLLPIDVAVGVSEALFVVTIVALVFWNKWRVERARARAQSN
ncbi:hypothetical protein SAMN05443637_110106 [Pseudonocardia thermophila]|jgi:hypothetical protein|uniref:Intracellular septation protein A n=1 Tax=Pseudonocardia thermophila TaxID=1848 RepID=A0A1M6UJ32_PSETH|nr:VC0807 family protein [Pseudonocardia thermophila]SHK69187.1 hypothetical protein SAMN05443637_110106 [Pseudonocardia thermophila]